MKLFLLLSLLITSAWAHEKELRTKADHFASGVFSERRAHPWPFPLLSIGHNMQSYQFYGGSPYWHDGLDIRSEVNAPIHLSVGGKVVNIENYQRGNHLYWEVAILDQEGFVWKYHHVDRKTIPEEIFQAYEKGSELADGTYIGNVVKWPISTFGEVYHHLHLLVVAKDGRYINPFLLLTPLADYESPVIKKIGLAKNHRPISSDEVSGPHALYLEVSDLVLHDKFILPPHKISYRLNGASEKVVWEFIHLPSGRSDTLYIEDFYMKGTCGNYQCRQFYINLNFTPEVPRQILKLPPGKHQVEVFVEDIAGNRTSDTYEWSVIN